MSVIASQITGDSNVCPIVCLDELQRSIKPRCTGPLWGKPLVTSVLPTQSVSNAESVFMSSRHHDTLSVNVDIQTMRHKRISNTWSVTFHITISPAINFCNDCTIGNLIILWRLLRTNEDSQKYFPGSLSQGRHSSTNDQIYYRSYMISFLQILHITHQHYCHTNLRWLNCT